MQQTRRSRCRGSDLTFVILNVRDFAAERLGDRPTITDATARERVDVRRDRNRCTAAPDTALSRPRYAYPYSKYAQRPKIPRANGNHSWKRYVSFHGFP